MGYPALTTESFTMRKIPIFVEGRLGLVGASQFSSWEVVRWIVPDGATIFGATIIAEIECDFAVVEHEVFYSGILRHGIAEGEVFTIGQPLGSIESTDSEYADYLKSADARRVCLTLEPSELGVIEDLKGNETKEDFALRILQEGLRQLVAAKAKKDAP